LARMNMILHGYATADIGSMNENTLATPHFRNPDGSLRIFDFAVANPPFSAKAWRSGFDPSHDVYGRFEGFGVPPPRNGDYAFLLHVVKSLKSGGKAAVILPHGVLFRGNKEADIRRNLVKRGLIKGIIGLPSNLFYGTGIPACLVIIDKENAHARTGIFMIDASRGFAKDGPKNRLREQDIRKIVDVFNGRLETQGYSRLVPHVEIEANDYNLNLPRYIDTSGADDVHDLEGHLLGGIPQRDIDALSRFWDVAPSLRAQLFLPADRPGYFRPAIERAAIKASIAANVELQTYADRIRSAYREWRAAHEQVLRRIKNGTTPRGIAQILSEDLLARFADLPLLDAYDVYQRFMEFWDETLQDDIYLVAADGWVNAAKPRVLAEDKDKKLKEAADVVVGRKRYKMDLLPPALVTRRFFNEGDAAYPLLEMRRIQAEAVLAEFIEEHTGEDGPLEDLVNDKGAVPKTAARARLKELANDAEAADEREVVTQCLVLIEEKGKADEALRSAQAAVVARYASLTEAEVLTLTVEDKWLTAVADAVDGEIEQLVDGLVARVRELEERYESSLPELIDRGQALVLRVKHHLAQMGFAAT
jgi:type I restriction enzyme M protein